MPITRKGRARVVADLRACLVEHNRVQQLARRVNSANVARTDSAFSPDLTRRDEPARCVARRHARA